ncbi:glyoxalase/bleomycin resistance protein/dioxygenase [Ketogulonicigenium robustum]|uniref:Glyoxalase/bleomycin resistance protein/dioxygenase n=1 Tax=Ketogulonicigenium robustum TaxID=92947 RepID=A0A1W6P241_9RHOB|nr:VOC family protein [Ketogulonicigenium robustum]ARO15499.1 glyoxalase/bleomycin resistance protein/dioxygenase [Ketogulonicigenium robustum]
MTGETSFRLGRFAPTLGVRDIDASYQAYNAVFGLQKVFSNGDPVGFMILKAGAAELHLTLQKGHHAAPFNVAHLMVDDVDAVHARCVAQGLRIIKRVQDKDYGLRAFVFADPDGNRIDVGQALER